ncbi:MAG: LytTR family transcriptional regulator [Clostridia bacterium]|nr:LytTR family transcriptional regulator [Clostridia bacterium]
MKFRLIIDQEKEEEVIVTVHRRSSLTDRLELLVQQEQGTDRIAAYTEDERKMLPFEEIECITVHDGKTYAIDTKGARYRLKLRLYELEKLLPACFIRINKSAIANEKRLDRYSAGFGGAVDAVFQSGYREYVSRRCFAEIKRRFDQE